MTFELNTVVEALSCSLQVFDAVWFCPSSGCPEYGGDMTLLNTGDRLQDYRGSQYKIPKFT
jgi:hypothetical protein